MAYKTWKTKEETQSGLKVKQFHADNAGEYKSDGFIDLHTESGTIVVVLMGALKIMRPGEGRAGSW